MTPEQMAACHALAFAGQGQVWTAAEFLNLLDSPHSFACGDARAFALGRVIAGEAELLTLATDPGYRRQGLATVALRAFEAEARRRGAETAFLEVGDDNPAALGLYCTAGYAEIARRIGYYRRSGGGRADALILRKTLA